MDSVKEYWANQEDKEVMILGQVPDISVQVPGWHRIIPVTGDSLEPGNLNKHGPVIQQDVGQPAAAPLAGRGRPAEQLHEEQPELE